MVVLVLVVDQILRGLGIPSSEAGGNSNYQHSLFASAADSLSVVSTDILAGWEEAIAGSFRMDDVKLEEQRYYVILHFGNLRLSNNNHAKALSLTARSSKKSTIVESSYSPNGLGLLVALFFLSPKSFVQPSQCRTKINSFVKLPCDAK